MRYIKTFYLAILAGIAIGIGGTIYLSLDNKVIGALFFAVGLYAICVHGLNLFTGKIGYIIEQKISYCIDLFLIWTGNLLGTWLTSFLLSFTRLSLQESAKIICEIKLNDSLLSLFVLGIFCGLLMFIAVDGYKKCQNPFLLFICVAVFILCGFEHCIADMFYFSIADAWSITTLIDILIISLGNTIGAIFIPISKKIHN
ncbi:formate/nitrite transporter family protein [Floccifex sp.]|uniref:formate/nitrite transporter family protein n=1 Tax=Floccifex sp. TaxID=2815810 RepID=UPI003F0F306E